MKSNIYYIWLAIIILLLVLGVVFYSILKSSPVPPTDMRTPLQLYQAGEQTTSLEERSKAFNAALSSYLAIERAFQPTMGTGVLQANLANTYFQLQEYPWAILYYFRALALRPTDETIKTNLHTALSKLQLPIPAAPTVWEKIFLLKGILSVPQILQLFTVSSLLSFFTASWLIWYPNKLLKACCIFSILIFLALSANLIYQRYFLPIEGVIVQAAPIYKGAGEQYTLVQEKPLSGGTKVEVLESPADGNWVKIRASDNTLGFVSAQSIRIL